MLNVFQPIFYKMVPSLYLNIKKLNPLLYFIDFLLCDTNTDDMEILRESKKMQAFGLPYFISIHVYNTLMFKDKIRVKDASKFYLSLRISEVIRSIGGSQYLPMQVPTKH